MGAFGKTLKPDTYAPVQYEYVLSALDRLDKESADEFVAALKQPIIPCSAISTTLEQLTGIAVSSRTILRWRHRLIGK